MKKGVKIGLITTGVAALIAGICALIRKKEEAPCQPGALRCSGSTLEECIEGKWTVMEEKSEQCGWTADPSPCKEGETKCQGYALQQCQSGKWVTIQEQSPSCGWVPGQKIKLSNLRCPSSVIVGIPFDISFTFSCSEEDAPACRSVTLTINGQSIKSVEVCLPTADQWHWLTDRLIFSDVMLSQPGSYDISVDGLTASIEAIEPMNVLSPTPTTELWDIHDAIWFQDAMRVSGEPYTTVNGKHFTQPEMLSSGCAFAQLGDLAKLGYRTWWTAAVSWPNAGTDGYCRFWLMYLPHESTAEFVSMMMGAEKMLEFYETRLLPWHIDTAHSGRLKGSGSSTLQLERDVTQEIVSLANFNPESERNVGLGDRIESRIPNVVTLTRPQAFLVYQTLGRNKISFLGLSPDKLEGVEPNAMSFECTYLTIGAGWTGILVDGWLNLKVEPISGHFDVVVVARLNYYYRGRGRKFMMNGWKVGEVNVT